MLKLSPDTIAWAIEHLTHYNDTDIFPSLFEFQAIKYNQDEVIRNFSKQDIDLWATRPFRRCLVPKRRYGFRVATQLDPLDMLLFLALFLETGEKIEKARLSTKHNISFSNHFKLDNNDYSVYDRTKGYREFQSYSNELIQRYPYVVITDIADFYSRIYFHRLENALSMALSSMPNHAKAILRLINGWNQTVSYGIPIGNAPSHLLAELVIDDIDRYLLAEGVVFTRYIDDYRIFCNSQQEGYKLLALLANTLFDSHGLTLQSEKTRILSADEFVNEVLEREERKEIEALANGFGEVIKELKLDNPYTTIEYDDLTPHIQRLIDGLNLEKLLQEQLERKEIDISMTRFLINRIGQLKRTQSLPLIMRNLDKLYPLFTEAVRYLARVSDDLSPETRQKVGQRLLEKLGDSVISQLEFHRAMIMGLFAGSNKWGNVDKIVASYGISSDSWFRRTALLALGKAGQDYWLRTNKSKMEQFGTWERRAFIYAASCFPKDEKKHWYWAIKPKMDLLENYVISYALHSPINEQTSSNLSS